VCDCGLGGLSFQAKGPSCKLEGSFTEQPSATRSTSIELLCLSCDTLPSTRIWFEIVFIHARRQIHMWHHNPKQSLINAKLRRNTKIGKTQTMHALAHLLCWWVRFKQKMVPNASCHLAHSKQMKQTSEAIADRDLPELATCWGQHCKRHPRPQRVLCESLI
jgi:hypothetical protein